MLSWFLATVLIYGLPLFYSLKAIKMGNGAPEENKKWAIYWLVAFISIPLFYIVSFLGCYLTSVVRVLFAVWLYHPSFEGCLLLDHLLRPHLDRKSTEINKFLTMSPLNVLKLTEEHIKTE